MIYLYSATPGTGKTCYVVKQLIERWTTDPKYKDRKIYANIEGLKIEGIEPPPNDFRQCQDGSIIIYDEAQDISHYSSETRDDPVARALSKHRHRGFDIHMITQDPALLNKWVLKNVYMHYYLWRPAQSQSITIYTFPRAIVTPTKQDFKTAFDKRLWRFEKYYLQFYKSTVINTSEKVPSTKKAGIITTGVVAAMVIGYFIQPLFSMGEVFDDPNTKTAQQAPKTPQNTQLGDNKATPPPTPQNTPQPTHTPQMSNNTTPPPQVVPTSYELQQKYLGDYSAEVGNDDTVRPAIAISQNGRCGAYNKFGEKLVITQTHCNDMLKNGTMPKPRQTYQGQMNWQTHH